MVSLELISTNYYHPIFSIKLSKDASKIISLLG